MAEIPDPPEPPPIPENVKQSITISTKLLRRIVMVALVAVLACVMAVVSLALQGRALLHENDQLYRDRYCREVLADVLNAYSTTFISIGRNQVITDAQANEITRATEAYHRAADTGCRKQAGDK